MGVYKKILKQKQFLESRIKRIIKEWEGSTYKIITPAISKRILYLSAYLFYIKEPFFSEENGVLTLRNYSRETFVPREKRERMTKSWIPSSISHMTGYMSEGGIEFDLDFYYLDGEKISYELTHLSYLEPNIKDYVSQDTMKVFGDLYD